MRHSACAGRVEVERARPIEAMTPEAKLASSIPDAATRIVDADSVVVYADQVTGKGTHRWEGETWVEDP